MRDVNSDPVGTINLDEIRTEIDAAVERARLLRRLLRTAMRLKVPLTCGSLMKTPPRGEGGRDHGQ